MRKTRFTVNDSCGKSESKPLTSIPDHSIWWIARGPHLKVPNLLGIGHLVIKPKVCYLPLKDLSKQRSKGRIWA